MKKITGKVIATVVAMAVVVSTLVGCTTAPKADSMFDVAGIVTELESYSYKMEMSVESEGVNYDIEVFGKCSKEAVSMGFTAEVNDEKYSVDDVIIATPTAMYFNLDEVMKEFAGDMDLGVYGVDADWIMIEWDEVAAEETDTTLADTLAKDANEAYKDIISKKDGKYTIKIDDKESAVEFVEATKNLLEENATDWSVLFADFYNSMDDSTASNDVMKSIMSNILMDINRTIDAGYTLSEINAIVDESFEVDDEEVDVEVKAEDVETLIEELVVELEDAIEDSDSADDEIGMEIEFTTYQNKNTYVTEFSMAKEPEDEDEKGDKIVYKYTIVSEKVKITIPSENVMTLGTALGNVFNKFGKDVDIENIEDSLSGMGSLGVLGGLGSMGDIYFDMDDFGDYDDFYSDDDYDFNW